MPRDPEPFTKPWTEMVRFRLFQMPCCGHNLCWLNPRLPSYCPECGKHVISDMRTGEHTVMACDTFIRFKEIKDDSANRR